MLSLLLTSSLLSTADAFCGTYVGGVGAELYNSYSQLAVVRKDNDTTLTIVNNVEGNYDIRIGSTGTRSDSRREHQCS